MIARLVLAASLLLATQAHAATYYVAPTGSDSAAGTRAAPWASFAKAQSVAAPGDTMYRDFGFFASFRGPTGNRIAVLAGERDTALMGVAENLSRPSSLETLRKAVKDTGSFEALYEIKGQKQVNLEARVVATASIDSAAIWTGGKTAEVSFPAE